jgi:hypothetical protein
MEIVEIISYFVNYTTDTIEVKFRTNEDDDEELRIDEINLSESDDFGYNLILEDIDLFIDDDDEFDEDSISEGDVDESELMSFLNEYYMIYPDRIPSKDTF